MKISILAAERETVRKLCEAHLAELGQTAFCIINGLDPLFGLGKASLEGVFERTQPWIDLENALPAESR